MVMHTSFQTIISADYITFAKTNLKPERLFFSNSNGLFRLIRTPASPALVISGSFFPHCGAVTSRFQFGPVRVTTIIVIVSMHWLTRKRVLTQQYTCGDGVHASAWLAETGN